MPVTTKKVLFIGEDIISGCDYSSNPKTTMKTIDKLARAYYKKSKKEVLSTSQVTAYLLDTIYYSSHDPAQNQVLMHHVGAFRDFNEDKCGLIAPVAIVFVVAVGDEITGVALPWDITPVKYDELYKQNQHELYLMGLGALVVMLHEKGKLELVNNMKECFAKHEMIRRAAIHGWAELNKDAEFSYTAITFPIDGSMPYAVDYPTKTDSDTADTHQSPGEIDKTIVLLNEFTIDTFTYKSDSIANTAHHLKEYSEQLNIEHNPAIVKNYNDFMAKAIQASIATDVPADEIRKLVGIYADLHEAMLNAKAPLYIEMIAGYPDGAVRGIVAPSPYNEFNVENHTDDDMDKFLHVAHAHLVTWIVMNKCVGLITDMNECRLKENLIAALADLSKSMSVASSEDSKENS